MGAQIPDFDEHGCLPPGVYSVSIEDVVNRFGGSKSLKRSQLTKNLKDFYSFVRYYATEIYIDGSYVTQKLAPRDIDMIVIFPLEFFANIVAHHRFSDFSKDHVKYKLHMFPFIDGKDEKKKKIRLNYFTHARPEDGGYEKGIIQVECKK
ncbi:MAG: hypothetical protein MUO30_12340 [Anaerolineales bacterium]|nr:hypothetical protein [Anaerolineales bacterium]